MANPAGIQVNGGGFINAAGVTLTTGRPIISNGHLEGFRVRSGNVGVNGKGLDTSGADYTRILAQAAQINAGIWATELNVVTGSNDIDAAGQHTPVPVRPWEQKPKRKLIIVISSFLMVITWKLLHER
ncbi:hypothetical protein JQU52_14305 [Paralysiella testudinis]|uniref:Filamentous haemagglutinin FhaB/tRNA nuclease CdiA-like TPS domain-containing protein n=3 Tax=Paralysiella testudinis TaxID=2809020 RepID=A0A892ZGP7_9NEIS|nr:hypothetical protein JQU52_14305 [Paralysiella testudinis]